MSINKYNYLFVTSRVILRTQGLETPKSSFAQVFAQLSWSARLPLARTISNRSHSAQSDEVESSNLSLAK